MPDVTVVPANEASWDDLQAVFGTSGDPSRCWCQRYKMTPGESWASVGASRLALRLLLLEVRHLGAARSPGRASVSLSRTDRSVERKELVRLVERM